MKFVDEVAWYRENSDGHTHSVGQKKANELGIYDMNGNISEWTNDAASEYRRITSALQQSRNIILQE